MAVRSRLRVAFVPGATPDKWARVWRERHPEVPLELLPVEDEQQYAVLDDGEADLCIARLPQGRASIGRDDLHCVILYDELQVAVAGKEHLIAAAEEVTLGDLAEEQLVVPHPSGWTPDVAQLQFPPMTVKDAIEVAASGTGLVIVPMSVARLRHRKDVVHRVVTDLEPTQVGLLWKKDDDSEIHQDFVGVTRGRRASSSR